MDISKVKFVKNRGKMLSCARLDFGDYELSVVTGCGVNSDAPEKYEIAIFEGYDFVQLPGFGFRDSDVIGCLTEDEVNEIIKKLFTITGNYPVFEERENDDSV
jgi:hypothetical protein